MDLASGAFLLTFLTLQLQAPRSERRINGTK